MEKIHKNNKQTTTSRSPSGNASKTNRGTSRPIRTKRGPTLPNGEVRTYDEAIDFLMNASADLKKKYAQHLINGLFCGQHDPDGQLDDWDMLIEDMSGKALIVQSVNSLIAYEHLMESVKKHSRRKAA